MTFINLREFSKLIEMSEPVENLSSTLKHYHQRYNISILFEDFQSLIDLAQKVNKRERTKTQKQAKGSPAQRNEIFVYGEFKLFSWTLVLYCLINNAQLSQLKVKDFAYIAQIFKQKSIDFIEYEVRCLQFSKDKYSREWECEEVELLQAINKQPKRYDRDRTGEDWKSVAFELFCRSSKKYFRPFQQCREKWINYVNPSVKKGDWTLQEDIELFQLINQYGCRWALISRQLKGTRSEHSIKNRYNSVIKNMRRQYKITSAQQVELKVLKYLKFRSDRKVKNQESLDVSVESKESRERSREIPLERVSTQERELSNTSQHAILDDVFNVQLQYKEEDEEPEEEDVNAAPFVYCQELEEEKKEKRTWEEEYEVKDGQISIVNSTEWCDAEIKIENPFFDVIITVRDPNLPDDQPMSSHESVPEQIREDIQEALGCGHYEKLMNDDWLFEGNWLDLDEQ